MRSGRGLACSIDHADWYLEGYYRSQHSRDGGATTERTMGRISWAEKRSQDRLAI